MGVLDDLLGQSQAAIPQGPAAQPNPEPQQGNITINPTGQPPQGSPLDDLLKAGPQQPTGEPQEPPGYAADIAKSAAIGVPKGLVSAAGAPGDARHFVSGLTDWLGNQFGIDKEKIENTKAGAYAAASLHPIMRMFTNPGSDEIQKGVEQVTGEFYKPQTSPGKFAETASEFVSNPLSYMGPGGLGLKAASALSAGVGSEGLGQLGEASGVPGAETAGRLIGAVAAGKIPHSVAQARFRSQINNAASTDELFDAADNLYDLSRTYGVTLRPQAGNTLADRITTRLRADGFRPLNQPQAFQALDELRTMANVADVQSVRKLLNKVAGTPNTQERAVARAVIADINQYMAHLPPGDVLAGGGNARRAVQDWREADRSYRAGMRAEALEEVLQRAHDRASTTGAGQNFENVLRQEIRQLVNSRTRSRGFSPDEIERLREIMRGDSYQNTLRAIGKLAPTGIVSGGIGLEIGRHIFGGLKSAGVPLAGHVAKHMSESRLHNAMDDVMARIRLTGSGQTPPVAPPSARSNMGRNVAPLIPMINEDSQ